MMRKAEVAGLQARVARLTYFEEPSYQDEMAKRDNEPMPKK